MQKKIRLDKYLCDQSIGSRSEVKNIIKLKEIYVNDMLITDSSIKIDPETDIVKYKDRIISYQKYSYYMLNKPSGLISATEDKLNDTVISLLEGVNTKGLFPVGRLDKDTEGLLLITNDGELAHNLLSPKKHVDKRYYVELDSPITDEEIKAIENGIDIGDDKVCLPCSIEIINNTQLYIKIKEGRYHQIKRMFGAFSHKVTYLKRISMGPIELDDSLNVGQFRALTNDELLQLKL